MVWLAYQEGPVSNQLIGAILMFTGIIVLHGGLAADAAAADRIHAERLAPDGADSSL
jgi:Na+/pantothenate symporter